MFEKLFCNFSAHFKGFGKVGNELSVTHLGFMTGIKQGTLIFAVIVKLMGVAGVKGINIFTVEKQSGELIGRFQISPITVLIHNIFRNIHRVDKSEIDSFF